MALVCHSESISFTACWCGSKQMISKPRKNWMVLSSKKWHDHRWPQDRSENVTTQWLHQCPNHPVRLSEVEGRSACAPGNSRLIQGDVRDVSPGRTIGTIGKWWTNMDGTTHKPIIWYEKCGKIGFWDGSKPPAIYFRGPRFFGRFSSRGPTSSCLHFWGVKQEHLNGW